MNDDREGTPEKVEEREPSATENTKGVSRKEKRKVLKKEKRKQIRKELAEKARAEEEARLNDPEEQRKIQLEEEQEKDRLERERKDFEERERIFLQELERKKKEEEEEEEEEEERRNAAERELKFKQEGVEEGLNEDDEWEYVEEGPPEIIWQGNEIIVKKNKVRLKKKDTNQDTEREDPNRPTSNPLPPQSEAYDAYKNAPMTSAQLLDAVAQQVPNFGTEQDKAHCPFHIKTGACRFGSRCNRVHYYPDKSNTLLIKNMYNGPGLAWEQDEGLEYTDEEVERSYEEFYEDVHTEFIKFGEIINFKVCRNGSFHLRGNVYVHYKSLDSAVTAYNSVHGRYFAGKQVKCEFVSVTRWKVAICGEYMKSRLKTCSRGTACNFLHCFSNPGGDYEWADFDKPPPKYWVKKMIALFGYSDDMQIEQSSDHNIFTSDRDGYHHKRHHSTNPHNGRSHRGENEVRNSRWQKDERDYERKESRKSSDRYYYARNKTSSDEDEKRRVRPRHRKDDSEDDGEHKTRRSSSERSEVELKRRRKRRRRNGHDGDGEYENVEKRHERSRSRDKNDERWVPEAESVDDYELEETSDRTRVKRKRI